MFLLYEDAGIKRMISNSRLFLRIGVTSHLLRASKPLHDCAVRLHNRLHWCVVRLEVLFS